MTLRFLGVTTSRADFGLLTPLFQGILSHSQMALDILATGSHFVEALGSTATAIIDAGFKVACEIPPFSTENTPHGACITMGHLLQETSQFLSRAPHQYHGMILLGDRFELWPIALAAAMHQLPIIHLHGGELTYGAIDDMVRHSVTKLASLHFPSIPEYAQRIIQMGELPERVFAVGALGIDNIMALKPWSPEIFQQKTGIDLAQPFALLTFHPVTREAPEVAAQHMRAVLQSVLGNGSRQVLLTFPNLDPGWHGILQVIEEFRGQFPTQLKTVTSLGQQGYLSALHYASVMVGNSSSGILESASFKLPVVNIGDRQVGRLAPANVLHAPCATEAIVQTLNRALSPEFKESLTNLINPYGDGQTAQRILKIIETIPWETPGALLPKPFYDPLPTVMSPPYPVQVP